MNTKHLSVLLLTAMIVALAAEGSALGKGADLTNLEACTGETIGLNGYEKRTLDLHNQTRADHGLQSLCVNPALTQAARAHSQEMLDDGYFGHDSINGETVEARLEDFGYAPKGYYSYWAYGENIAWGKGGKALPDNRFEEWMGSPEHRDNILDGDFSEIGIGALAGESNEAGTMYTVDFGTRR